MRHATKTGGRNTWTPKADVVAALDTAFTLSFDNVKPAGGKWLLAVDVSGSMQWSTIQGIPGVTPAVGAAAMTVATLRSEEDPIVTAFSTRLTRVSVAKSATLAEVQAQFAAVPMGGTDCAQPMLYALEQGLRVNTFVVYTDSETWFGRVHPAAALKRYRQATGIPARLIVCGMVANRFTIADPKDPGMLDVVGFDTRTPQIMADFARGAI